MAITDRQKFDDACKLTIQFNFGSICDVIDQGIASGAIPRETGEALKRQVRRFGNDSIRVIANHLDFYNITRNHRKDQINPGRVIAAVQQKDNV